MKSSFKDKPVNMKFMQSQQKYLRVASVVDLTSTREVTTYWLLERTSINVQQQLFPFARIPHTPHAQFRHHVGCGRL